MWPKDRPALAVAFGVPAGCSGLILAVGAASLVSAAAAVAAWLFTGEPAWIYEFLRVPAALLTVWLAAVACWLCGAARAQFAPGELMRRVWTWIGFSAGADFAGSVCLQILAANSRLNPLRGRSDLIRPINTAGHILGGPMRFALLAVGVWYAILAYRRARFLGRLRPLDWGLLALFALYLARNVVDVTRAIDAGKVVTWVEAANWPTDPLLGVLFAMAMLLFRSVNQMGGGWIGRCWEALSIGVFLTAVGDVATWALAYGYLPQSAMIGIWFCWLPAAACFAVAPAYQLEAIANARAGRVSEIIRR